MIYWHLCAVVALLGRTGRLSAWATMMQSGSIGLLIVNITGRCLVGDKYQIKAGVPFWFQVLGWGVQDWWDNEVGLLKMLLHYKAAWAEDLAYR